MVAHSHEYVDNCLVIGWLPPIVEFWFCSNSIKYNKLTDVGAQSLGDSLTKCKNIRTLR